MVKYNHFQGVNPKFSSNLIVAPPYFWPSDFSQVGGSPVAVVVGLWVELYGLVKSFSAARCSGTYLDLNFSSGFIYFVSHVFHVPVGTCDYINVIIIKCNN